MGGADSAAKELDAVIEIVVHLYIVHFGTGAHALEGDTVELVFRVDVGAGVADHHVFENTGIVLGLVAAEGTGVRLPFLGAGGGAALGALGAVVDRREAIDDQPAPQAACVGGDAAGYGLIGCEGDWLLCGTLGVYLATLLDHHEIR